MRSLEMKEIYSVAGGNGRSGSNASSTASRGSAARKAAVLQCRGLADNAQVSFSYSVSANVSGKVGGVGGEATTNQSVTVTTTCGDLRAAEKAAN